VVSPDQGGGEGTLAFTAHHMHVTMVATVQQLFPLLHRLARLLVPVFMMTASISLVSPPSQTDLGKCKSTA